MEKKTNKTTTDHISDMIDSIRKNDNVGAYVLLNKVLKEKCAKRIVDTLRDVK